MKAIFADLRKPSNIEDNDVVSKTVYNKLVTNVLAIDVKVLTTRGLVTGKRYLTLARK